MEKNAATNEQRRLLLRQSQTSEIGKNKACANMGHLHLQERFLDPLEDNCENPSVDFAAIQQPMAKRPRATGLHFKRKPLLLSFGETANTQKILQEIIENIRRHLSSNEIIIQESATFLRFWLVKPFGPNKVPHYAAEISSIRQGIVINVGSGESRKEDLEDGAYMLLKRLDSMLQECPSSQELPWSPAFICTRCKSAGEPQEKKLSNAMSSKADYMPTGQMFFSF